MVAEAFHRVQFRRAWQQRYEDNVIGHLRLAARLVPASAIQEQRADVTACDLWADLFEMQVYAFGIGGRCDDRRAEAAGWACHRLT